MFTSSTITCFSLFKGVLWSYPNYESLFWGLLERNLAYRYPEGLKLLTRRLTFECVRIFPIGSDAKEPVKAVGQSKVSIQPYELHNGNGWVDVYIRIYTSATVVTSESLRILSTEAFRDVFQRCGLTYQGWCEKLSEPQGATCHRTCNSILSIKEI